MVLEESHSSFCPAVPGAGRGPLDLEALAEGADTGFTRLISSASNYPRALRSSSPPPATCSASLCPLLQPHVPSLGTTLTETLLEHVTIDEQGHGPDVL